jgi:hypothetical protein
VLALFFAAVARVTIVRAQDYAVDSASGTVPDCPPGFCSKNRGFEFFCVNLGRTDGCESSISAAVAKISFSDVIITVAPGTYTDNVSINTGAKPKPLNLTIASSSTAAATIINGNGAGSGFHDWTQRESRIGWLDDYERRWRSD